MIFDDFKTNVRREVEKDGILPVIAALSLILAMAAGFLAFLAWVWWPLPLVLLSLVGLATWIAVWASKEDAA